MPPTGKVTIVLRLMIILLLASASLSGCVSHTPPVLYRLDSGALQVPERTAGMAVLLAPVVLADYLQREAILQRRADGSLSTDLADGRWAGSLQQDIDQLLLRQLASRLNSQCLSLSPASEGFAADIQVELSITRLDSGPQHPAVLEAQWRLLDGRGKERGRRLVSLQEGHQGSTADQVRAQSALMQRLSELLAQAIEPLDTVAHSPPPRIEARPRKPRVAPPEKAEISRLPLLRTDTEVFRF